MRLTGDPSAIAQVAREALRLCHFDPDTGEDRSTVCGRACYECLLSYTNQLAHALLDRHLVRGYLMQLAQAATTRVSRGRAYEEQYAWLQSQSDQASTLEREFLDHLYRAHRRLPDRAQHRPESTVYAEADFYYDRPGTPGIAVFCDGSPHDDPLRDRRDKEERSKLEDLGYRIIAIRYDLDIDAQIGQHEDVFGPGIRQ